MKAVMGRKWRSRKVLRCNEITTTTTNSDNNHKTQNTIKRFGIKKWKPWTLVSFCSFSLVLGWSLRTLASPQKKIVSPGGSNYICYIGGGKTSDVSWPPEGSISIEKYWKGVLKEVHSNKCLLHFYDKGEGNGVLSPLSSQFRPPVWLLLLSTARGEVSEVPSPLRVAISGQGTLSQSLNERVERNHDSALQMIQQLCYYIISSMH